MQLRIPLTRWYVVARANVKGPLPPVFNIGLTRFCMATPFELWCQKTGRDRTQDPAIRRLDRVAYLGHLLGAPARLMAWPGNALQSWANQKIAQKYTKDMVRDIPAHEASTTSERATAGAAYTEDDLLRRRKDQEALAERLRLELGEPPSPKA